MIDVSIRFLLFFDRYWWLFNLYFQTHLKGKDMWDFLCSNSWVKTISNYWFKITIKIHAEIMLINNESRADLFQDILNSAWTNSLDTKMGKNIESKHNMLKYGTVRKIVICSHDRNSPTVEHLSGPENIPKWECQQ